MKELQQKQKFKRRLYSLPSLVVVFILTIFMVRGAIAVIKKDRDSADAVLALQAKMVTLSKREAVITEDTAKLSTNEGIDEEIKQKFNVSREGERVAVILDPANNASSTGQEDTAWYKRIWNAIIH